MIRLSQLFKKSTTIFALGCALAFPCLVHAELKTSLTSTMANPQEPGTVTFAPPTGWRFADPKGLPKYVHVMVVGESQHGLPPSINLGTERFSGTLKAYLKIVKALNDKQGFEWKDLGSIQTEAGEASLSQVDSKTPWGDLRMMHVILLKNGTIYILTAAALKEEFPQFYKDFFQSLRSLHINKDVFEMVESPSRRSELQKQVAFVTDGWKEINQSNSQPIAAGAQSGVIEDRFSDDNFQSKYWIPFTSFLEKDYSDMGAEWKRYTLIRVKDSLFEGKGN